MGKRRSQPRGKLLSQLLPPLPIRYIRPCPELPPEIWEKIMNYINDERVWIYWGRVCLLFYNLTYGDPFPKQVYGYQGRFYSSLRKMAITIDPSWRSTPYQQLCTSLQTNYIHVSWEPSWLHSTQPYYSPALKMISANIDYIYKGLILLVVSEWDDDDRLSSRESRIQCYQHQIIWDFVEKLGWGGLKSRIGFLSSEKLRELWKEILTIWEDFGIPTDWYQIERISIL